MGARFWWLGSHPLNGPINREHPDAEEFGLGVGAEVVQLQHVLGRFGFNFGCLPRLSETPRLDHPFRKPVGERHSRYRGMSARLQSASAVS